MRGWQPETKRGGREEGRKGGREEGRKGVVGRCAVMCGWDGESWLSRHWDEECAAAEWREAVGGRLPWCCRQRRFSVLDFELVWDFDIGISDFLFGCGRWRSPWGRLVLRARVEPIVAAEMVSVGAIVVEPQPLEDAVDPVLFRQLVARIELGGP